MLSAFSQLIFGGSGLFGQNDGTKLATWRDKSLCFDLRPQDLLLDRGEQLIGCFFPIEDVKGNQDELGVLEVTNLRLIWICCKKKRVNLSIGWRTVSLAYEQNVKDALGGATTNLFVLAKYESTKYEFVFNRQYNNSSNDQRRWSHTTTGTGNTGDKWQTKPWQGSGAHDEASWRVIGQLKKISQDKNLSISQLSPMYLDNPFVVVFKVWQAYKQTQLFRHCRANLSHLIVSSDPPLDPTNSMANLTPTSSSTNLKLGELNKLPAEEVIETLSAIQQSESRSIRYVGTLVLTNIRLIWIDEVLPLRNLSIPYIAIESVKLKQGDRIIVNTHDYLTNSTHVELRAPKTMGPNSRNAKSLFEQIQNLYLLYKGKPRFGPESCDECLNFMSHLRPIGHYFEMFDDPSKRLENFGPEVQHGGTMGTNDIITSESWPISGGHAGNKSHHLIDDDDATDRAENELSNYSSKLISYLNEQPIENDQMLIYSTELGLAIEKPVNGADLARIWRIEL